MLEHFTAGGRGGKTTWSNIIRDSISNLQITTFAVFRYWLVISRFFSKSLIIHHRVLKKKIMTVTLCLPLVGI